MEATAMTTITRRLRRGLPAVALTIPFAAGVLLASAAEMADPGRQGEMFKRIFSYDKDLRGSEKIVVIVVAEARSGREVDKVASVFREKGLYPAVVNMPRLVTERHELSSELLNLARVIR